MRVEILEWKSFEKNTLRGFVTAQMPSGVIFRGLMVHMKGDVRWISFPSREYTDKTSGARRYAPFVDFTSREKQTHFCGLVLGALDVYLASAPQRMAS
jgi:hypothetical protein